MGLNRDAKSWDEMAQADVEVTEVAEATTETTCDCCKTEETKEETK